MQIIIKTLQIDSTPAFKEYIEMKINSLDKFLKKFQLKNEVKIEILIERLTRHHRHGKIFLAEANMNLPKKILSARAYNEDPRAAVDNLKDELYREIIRYKEFHINIPVRKSKLESNKQSALL